MSNNTLDLTKGIYYYTEQYNSRFFKEFKKNLKRLNVGFRDDCVKLDEDSDILIPETFCPTLPPCSLNGVLTTISFDPITSILTYINEESIATHLTIIPPPGTITGQVLTWNQTTGLWNPGTPVTGYSFSILGNMGVGQLINAGDTLNILADRGFTTDDSTVDTILISPPAGTVDGEVMTWDNTLGIWKPSSPQTVADYWRDFATELLLPDGTTDYTETIKHNSDIYINQNVRIGNGPGNNGNNVVLGNDAGTSNSGNDTVFVGKSSGVSNIGNDVVGIGTQAAEFCGANHSIGIGKYAIQNLFGGYENIGIGYRALMEPVQFALDGITLNSYALCIGIGEAALRNLDASTLDGNIMTDIIGIGYSAVRYNIIGIGNNAASHNEGSQITAFGAAAAEYNTGNKIAAIGSFTAYQNTGQNVVAIGVEITDTEACAAYNTGDFVIAIGSDVATNNIGHNVIALGQYVARTNSGNNIIALGTNALDANTGTDVIGIGINAGGNNTGDRNIFMGLSSGFENHGTNVVALGSSSAQLNTGNDVIALGGAAGWNNTLSSVFVISNDSLPSFITRSAAVAAITVALGATAGCTYLYYNETTYQIEGIRL